VTTSLQDSARHARYLALRTARVITSRFNPSLLDWAALSCWRHRQSSRAAATSPSTNISFRLSRTQDDSDEGVTENDASQARNAAATCSDPESSGCEVIRDVHEARVAVDNVSAFDDNENRINGKGNAGEADGNRSNGRDENGLGGGSSRRMVAESSMVREAWPSRLVTEVSGASDCEQGDSAPESILPQAATATLNATSEVETQQAPESFTPSDAAEISNMDSVDKVSSIQESKRVAQVVALYEVYVRCALQVCVCCAF
jgi:hypothetical protein